jgi:hypothetical protein
LSELVTVKKCWAAKSVFFNNFKIFNAGICNISSDSESLIELEKEDSDKKNMGMSMIQVTIQVLIQMKQIMRSMNFVGN